MMANKFAVSWLLIGALCSMATYAESTKFTMFTTAKHTPVGYITVENTKYGLFIKPFLAGVPAGVHGFHVHETPDCGEHGMAAGGHLDPAHTKRHLGPYGNGHLGDLPVLYANKNGYVTLPILAPRLKVRDLHNHSLIIHIKGDNYSDEPKKLGGGSVRWACGVIKHNKFN